MPTHIYIDEFTSKPYVRQYTITQSESECKRILRAIYWMLFSKRYQLTQEDRWYLRRKIWTQRVYEFENKKKIVPNYIYRFYNTILLFDKHASNNDIALHTNHDQL